MAVIRVPKTPMSAFDMTRKPSTLLRAQVEHLEAATRVYPSPPSAQKAKRKDKNKTKKKVVRTEQQAAERIHELTHQLQARGGQPAIQPPTAVAEPAAPKPKRMNPKRSRRRTRPK